LNFLGIIPARYASTRFPGKPLVMINGKSMLRRVYEQSKKSDALSRVIIATDDVRIKIHAEEFGGEVIMTSESHKSGTDRCNEVIQLLKERDENNINSKITKSPNYQITKSFYDVVINIQGDEPFINPSQIDLLSKCFFDANTKIATLVKKVSTKEELINPNVVKVILDSDRKALYFSRAVIPFIRGKEQNDWLSSYSYFKHIGIYAYTVSALESIAKLEQSSLEKAESLEQLRWLENGFSIQTEITDFESFSIDSPDDLLTINQQLSDK
jgi:3-deoxy-manno-octulosonate cytidylyltransferase (CMP-KDO synthetase)